MMFSKIITGISVFIVMVLIVTPSLQARDYSSNKESMKKEIEVILLEMTNVTGEYPPRQNLKYAIDDLKDNIDILGSHTDEHFIQPPDLRRIKKICEEILKKFNEQELKLHPKIIEIDKLERKRDFAEKVYNKFHVKRFIKYMTATVDLSLNLIPLDNAASVLSVSVSVVDKAVGDVFGTAKVDHPNLDKFFDKENQDKITKRIKIFLDNKGPEWVKDLKTKDTIKNALNLRFKIEIEKLSLENKIKYEAEIKKLTPELKKLEEQVSKVKINLKEYLKLCARIRGFTLWKVPKRAPEIKVIKSASSTNVKQGDNVTYTYQVTNPGNVPLFPINISDDKCFSLSLKSGDLNGNDTLEPQETWIYECSMVLNADSTNTVTVTGTDQATSKMVSDSAKVSVTVQTVPVLTTSGCQAPKVKVPNLLYMTEAQAIRALKKNRLIEKVTQRKHSRDINVGQVMAQNPSRDECVSLNSFVKIEISLGPKKQKRPSSQPARLSAEFDCGNSFELVPGDFAGRGCGIVVKGWRSNTDDRVKVKIEYNKSSGIEVVPGDTSAPPSLMYTAGVSDSHNQYIFSQSFRAKNNAPPGITRVTIIVSQAGTGSVTLTLDIAVLRKGLQPSDGPGISPPVDIATGSGGQYCVWRFKMFGDPKDCFNFAAAKCDLPRYTNQRNGYELVGSNMTWSEADARVSQLSRYFQDAYGCLDGGQQNDTERTSANDTPEEDSGPSDEPDDPVSKCKNIEGSHAVINRNTQTVECLCDPLVLNGARNRCIDCEPYRQAYMAAVIEKNFNRAQAIIGTATNCSWSRQAQAELNEFKTPFNPDKNSRRCQELEARINSLANQVPSVNMDQVNMLHAQSMDWECSLSPDTFRTMRSASNRQQQVDDKHYEKTKEDIRREDEQNKRQYEKWMAEVENIVKTNTSRIREPLPQKKREPISNNTNPPKYGGSNSGGMSSSECPRQNPGTKLNIYRPSNRNRNYVYCSYHKNGQLAIQHPYINKKIEGVVVVYFSNGQLKSKTEYKNGWVDGSFVQFQIKNGRYYKAREGRNKKGYQVKGSVKRYPAPK